MSKLIYGILFGSLFGAFLFQADEQKPIVLDSKETVETEQKQ